MEVKNGIIMDGVLHEMERMKNIPCMNCSLKYYCDELENRHSIWLCSVHPCLGFINRGKVTNIEIEEETK